MHHRVEVLNVQDDILIRLGEHDTESIDEPHPHVDRKIKDIIIHPKYDRKKVLTEGYDLALIELDNPVDYALNIIPICLPTDDNKLVGETGWATGFGLISTANFSITGNFLLCLIRSLFVCSRVRNIDFGNGAEIFSLCLTVRNRICRGP